MGSRTYSRSDHPNFHISLFLKNAGCQYFCSNFWGYGNNLWPDFREASLLCLHTGDKSICQSDLGNTDSKPLRRGIRCICGSQIQLWNFSAYVDPLDVPLIHAPYFPNERRLSSWLHQFPKRRLLNFSTFLMLSTPSVPVIYHLLCSHYEQVCFCSHENYRSWCFFSLLETYSSCAQLRDLDLRHFVRILSS